MGVEGETYEVTEDGEYKYMDHITNSEDGLTMEQELVKYLTWPGGGAPGLFKQEYFKGAESSEQELESASILEPYMIEEAWPGFSYTPDEIRDLDSFGADIEKYTLEMTDKFIAGETSFDEWDNFVETIENMGLERYLEIQQAAYERYKE